MSRKLILCLAMSLDGFIVDKDGGYDWIKGDGDKTLDTEKKFDFIQFLNDIDIVLMGSKSFFELPDLEFYKNQRIIVASRKEHKDYDNVRFVKGNLIEIIKTLKAETGKGIWLFGGSNVVNQVTTTDLVDEYILAYIPTIVGDGTRLFDKGNMFINLHLDEYVIDNGQMIATYSKRKLEG
ncbi:dihydrofolate reductase family protein [Candidatus Izimaplasma bacterium HR1]|uniref:dihydrofolate reductase family protein n=1 Tax=Candidatus Izimoplasma sp. HR1 TaxID=1541959 RepID=UPI00056E3A45